MQDAAGAAAAAGDGTAAAGGAAGPIACLSSRAPARGGVVRAKRSRSRSARAEPHRSRKAAARGAALVSPSMKARVWWKRTARASRLLGGSWSAYA